MEGKYLVAVVGGACAGSEITDQLVKAGMEVVVFEQNPLPYGKIEDGLPRWHHKMQLREYGKVDGKINNEGVHFMPKCKLGQDITTDELVNDWGFQMVVLANGAWRDRPLRIKGADQVTDQSLVYQNPFVYWFNHYEDADYEGPSYTVPPGAAVIGGGLASLDMVKAFQFEVVKNALAERGLTANLLDMEHKGVHYVLEKHGLSWEGLGLAPARLFYRKRICDMPLVPLPDDASEERLAKAAKTREKLMGNAMKKYAFEVCELHSPAEIHTQDGSLVAVSFELMEPKDGRFVKTGEQARVEIPFLVSSIGSLPQEIPGIPMDGDLYNWEDTFTGQVAGMNKFYCVGNAITGRGNIKESLNNAKRLGTLINNAVNEEEPDYAALFRAQEAEAREHVVRLIGFLNEMPEASDVDRQRVRNLVDKHHKSIGYSDYETWRDAVVARHG